MGSVWDAKSLPRQRVEAGRWDVLLPLARLCERERPWQHAGACCESAGLARER